MVKKFKTVKNSDISDLVKKTDWNTKVGETENKRLDRYHNSKNITTHEFNRLKAEIFVARLKQANLATKVDIDDFTEKTDCKEF